MNPNKKKSRMRHRRHRHARKKLEGTPERPRLCVFRSNAHIYAQVIDDLSGKTLIGFSSLNPAVKAECGNTGNKEAADKVGRILGKKCLEAGIGKLVFDRGGYKYHGRVKALAEGVREEYRSAKKEMVF